MSYSSVCEVVNSYLEITKIPNDLKKEALSISCTIQLIIEEEDAEDIEGMLNSVSVLNQVTPENMEEEQEKDPILRLIFYSQRKIKIIGHQKDQVKSLNGNINCSLAD